MKVYLFKFLQKGTALLNINYFDFPLATGVFEILHNNQFKSAIKTCELVKSGIYKLDKNETITLSTRQSITNKYEETLTPLFITNPNEGATVEFSSPLYAFFEKDQMLNIYMKDEFPLLIVANDRILLKAPHIGA